MSAIKDGRYPIFIGGAERHILFDLNVLDEMQDKLGSIDNMADALQGEHGMKNTKWLLTLVLNEGKEDNEPDLEERQVGKFIHVGNMKQIISELYKAFALGNIGNAEEAQDTAEDEADADGEEEPDSDNEKNVAPGEAE